MRHTDKISGFSVVLWRRGVRLIAKGKLMLSKLIPFVCLNEPFICRVTAINKPFVVTNEPFVRSIGFYRGFTLIEALVVVAVIGVLTMLAAPSFQTFVESNRLSAATNDLISDMALARVEALKRGQGQVVMCVSTDGASCAAAPATWNAGWLVFWDQDSSNSYSAAADLLLKAHPAMPGTLATAIKPDNTVRVTYNRLGNAVVASPGMQFRLSNTKTGKNRLICLLPTGRGSAAKEGTTCCTTTGACWYP